MNDANQVMKSTARGTLWNGGTYAVSKTLVFLTTMFLARILVPEDFGLLALGMLAINYLDTFSDFGIGEALIYQRDNVEEAASTAFSLSAMMGAAMTGLAFLSAPLVAAFFREPKVIPVVQALGFTFIINNIGSVFEACIKKQLGFRQRAVPEIGKMIVRGSTSIVLALTGWGVWSLVWGQLIGGVASAALYWLVSRQRFWPMLNWDVARSLLGYSWQLVLVSLLGFIHNNVDYLIVGRRLDTTQLGYYTIAFRIPELGIISICYVLSQALFPAYAKLQNELAALRNGFLAVLRYISLITLPAGVGMFLVAPEFIEVFYTNQWAPAIPVMQVLSLYALIYSLSFNAGDIYKAIGKPSILNKLGIVKLLITVPVLWVAASHGIFWVGVGQVLTTLVLTVVRLAVACRVIAVRPVTILHTIRPASIGVSVMLVGALVLRSQIVTISPVLRLLALLITGVMLYTISVWLVDRQVFMDGLELLGVTNRAHPLVTAPVERSVRRDSQL